MKKRNNAILIKGFSLIELLCALVIGIIISTIVLEIFIDYKKSHAIELALATMQENARFASFIIGHSIEHAGFIGCAKLTDNFPIYNEGVMAINNITSKNYFMACHGIKTNWIPVIPNIYKLKPKNNTDLIMAKNLSPLTATILQRLNSSKMIYLSANPQIYKNKDILISDCLHAVLSRTKSTYKSKTKNYQLISTTKTIDHLFDSGAELGQIKTNIYFIKATTRKNKSAEKIYALYQFNESNKIEELISNINDLKVVCYEKDLTGNIREILPNQVINWNNVLAIKVKLLLVSENSVLEKAKSYIFNGIKYFPNDKRIYKEYQFTVLLKEHGVI